MLCPIITSSIRDTSICISLPSRLFIFIIFFLCPLLQVLVLVALRFPKGVFTIIGWLTIKTTESTEGNNRYWEKELTYSRGKSY